MACENMNRMIFRVGALGVIVIALVAFVPPLVMDSRSTSSDMYNLETSCWCPAHFEDSHVEFVNAVCADEVRHNKTRPFPPSAQENGLNIVAMEQDELTINDIITQKPKLECFTLMCLSVELMLLFAFYAVVNHKSQVPEQNLDEKMRKELLPEGHEVKVSSRSCLCVVVYIVMVAAFAFMMVAPHFAAKKQVGKSTYHSGQAFCDFSIRHLGRTLRYTVQCFYSYEEPSGVNMLRALMMNSALCGVIGVMSLIKIFTTICNRK